MKTFTALATARVLQVDRSRSIAVISPPERRSCEHLKALRASTSNASEKTWTPTSTPVLGNGPSGPGLVDTSLVIALRSIEMALLPPGMAISACARAYGRICAGVVAVGRKPGRARSVDLMIAATALAHRIPLYTLNASDLRGLDDLIEIVDLSWPGSCSSSFVTS
jgi:hypothetical protein